MHPLDRFQHQLNIRFHNLGPGAAPELTAARERFIAQLKGPGRAQTLQLIEELQTLTPPSTELRFGKSVRITEQAGSTEGGEEFQRLLAEAVLALCPWRKGPFELFGIEIDAEWRSDLKFARLGLNERDVRGKRIADVGCGNGYYMFRLLEHRPELIVGFDPVDRYFMQFLLVQGLLSEPPPIIFEPLRSEFLRFYPAYFDLSLCMGVLYHVPNSQLLLEELFQSLRPGGTLYLETIYMPEGGSLLLEPEARYARMKNVRLIPSIEDLLPMLTAAGFSNPVVLTALELSTDEQRSTPFAPGESLIDFLDPNDSRRTIEGHIRPHRAVIRATK